MSYTTFPAQIRQHRIVLDSAVELPENSDVLIVVLGNDHRQQLSKEHHDLEQERNDWYAIAAQSLERAYSDDEPDYSNVPLIEVNPLYRYANQNPETSTKTESNERRTCGDSVITPSRWRQQTASCCGCYT